MSLVLLALACCLGAPGVASAGDGRRVASLIYPPMALLLAGDQGVVWIVEREDSVFELWARDVNPAHRARRIQRFQLGRAPLSPSFPRFDGLALTASSTHVALQFITRDMARSGGEQRQRLQTFAGRLGGRLAQIGACPPTASAARAAGGVSLDGATVVFATGPGCARVARDLVAGPASDRPVGRDEVIGAVVGRYEARLERPDGAAGPIAAVVRDRITGSELTRAYPISPTARLLLRDDGTLALRDGSSVAIVDPGATAPRTLPITLTTSVVRWVGTQLAVVTADDPPDGDGGVLRLIDTDGRTTRRVVELGEDPELAADATFNATHAAWLTRGCAGVQIRTRAMSDPGTVASRSDRCPLRLIGRRALRGRHLRLAVSCAGFIRDCGARITVRLGGTVIARGDAVTRGSDHDVARADLIIRPAARPLMRRHRLTLQISGQYSTTPWVTTSTRGSVTRHATVSLRPR